MCATLRYGVVLSGQPKSYKGQRLVYRQDRRVDMHLRCTTARVAGNRLGGFGPSKATSFRGETMQSSPFPHPTTTPPVLFAPPSGGLQSTAAAAYLGVARQTLANWRVRGEGPRYARLGKSGARIVYRVSDLDLFLAERMIGDI